MTKWKSMGLIFLPDKYQPWAQSHAQVPTCFIKDNSTLRIFYSSRDAGNVGRVSFFDVNADNPSEIKYVHDKPILESGKPGTFDDCGVMPSCVVTNMNKLFLYYIGWNIRNTVPYYNSVGLAVSEDNGLTFKRYSEGPLWDRNYLEPYFSASSCVLYNGKIWKCWYLSCTEYRLIQGIYEPRYHIKYAESDDGVKWNREGKIAIDYKSDEEGGIARPSVQFENGIYKMWYSYRNLFNYRIDPAQSYKIGYAESTDGMKWDRQDDVQFVGESQFWDNNMRCYPNIVNVRNRKYMFYNGNGFGINGIGYAEATR